MTKKELRIMYRDKRNQLSPNDLKQISIKICDSAMGHFQLENKVISLFMPIERKQEINTNLIWEKAKFYDTIVAVPKTNFETGEMIHVELKSINQLEISQYGIPEPKTGEILAPSEFDIVFVPLLAVSKRGHRVGYGKGFYDRFLKKCSPSCQFVGLHLFDSLDTIDDLLPSDIALDFCVTPKKVICFKV
jgi:5-formyltetrahydrofolate cyclo-ligase